MIFLAAGKLEVGGFSLQRGWDVGCWGTSWEPFLAGPPTDDRIVGPVFLGVLKILQVGHSSPKHPQTWWKCGMIGMSTEVVPTLQHGSSLLFFSQFPLLLGDEDVSKSVISFPFVQDLRWHVNGPMAVKSWCLKLRTTFDKLLPRCQPWLLFCCEVSWFFLMSKLIRKLPKFCSIMRWEVLHYSVTLSKVRKVRCSQKLLEPEHPGPSFWDVCVCVCPQISGQHGSMAHEPIHDIKVLFVPSSRNHVFVSMTITLAMCFFELLIYA